MKEREGENMGRQAGEKEKEKEMAKSHSTFRTWVLRAALGPVRLVLSSSVLLLFLSDVRPERLDAPPCAALRPPTPNTTTTTQSARVGSGKSRPPLGRRVLHAALLLALPRDDTTLT